MQRMCGDTLQQQQQQQQQQPPDCRHEIILKHWDNFTLNVTSIHFHFTMFIFC